MPNPKPLTKVRISLALDRAIKRPSDRSPVGTVGPADKKRKAAPKAPPRKGSPPIERQLSDAALKRLSADMERYSLHTGVDANNFHSVADGEGEELPTRVEKDAANQVLVNRAREYEPELHEALRHKQEAFREFLLGKILPLMHSLSGGVADYSEVVGLALGETPRVEGLNALIGMLQSRAVAVKMETYLSQHFELTAQEDRAYRLLTVLSHLPEGATTNGNDIEALLRAVLEVP